MINLPAVIQEMPNLILEKPAFEAKLDLGLKKYVFAITRDFNEDDKKLISEYGKLVYYNDRIHCNIPIDTYDWEYLVFDLRNSEDRYALMRTVIPYRQKYNLIVYSYKFEQDEIIPDADNHISSLPKIQARKLDFDALLLQQRLKKPRWYMSLFSCMIEAYHKVKN
jgi:hypothetical protein